MNLAKMNSEPNQLPSRVIMAGWGGLDGHIIYKWDCDVKKYQSFI
jgi:hypothetical protein